MSEVVNDLNLFTVLEQGDRRIDTVKDNVIMMVGRTRAGKSCTFNWILGRIMIGEGDQIQAFYVTVNKTDNEAAQLSNQFASKTLIPNLAHLDSETSLLDMAGYGDTRNYIGVMGVSYFLKSVFQRVKKVKFLIVFNEHEFFDSTGGNIISTFNGFLSMFKKELLTPSIKQKLFNSISLLVTRSRQPHMHSAYLNKVLKNLKNPQFKCQNKELMTEMIERLIPMNRLDAFQNAVPHQNSKQCTILKTFDLMKWQFLNVNDVSSIFNIPFQADYKLLTAEDQQLLLGAINERIEIYSHFSSILKELMSSLKLNWSLVVDGEVQNIPDNFMDSVLCFDSVFATIEDFLEKGDKYHSQNLVVQEVKAQYPRLNLVQAIRRVLAIYEVAKQINDQFGQFHSMMTRYTELFAELTDCILPFCANAAQEKLILRLRFILTRGFREFIKFYQIKPQQISRVSQDMKDKCSTHIHEEGSTSFIEHFIKHMNKDLLVRIFKTIPEVQDYESLFTDYINKYVFSAESERQNEEKLNFNKSTIGIKFVKAGIYLRDGDRVKAGSIFVFVLQLLCAQGELLQKMDPTIRDVEKQLNSLYLQKLQVIQKIVKILAELDIKKYPRGKDLAVSLCEHTKQIEAACEIYELMLESYPQDVRKRITIYQNYANYCIRCGRYSYAKKLLQKKLRLQTQNYEERAQTVNQIYQLVQDYGRFVDQEKQILSRMGRLEQSDSQLVSLLEEINKQISL